jgi:hypothetical protein
MVVTHAKIAVATRSGRTTTTTTITTVARPRFTAMDISHY